MGTRDLTLLAILVAIARRVAGEPGMLGRAGGRPADMPSWRPGTQVARSGRSKPRSRSGRLSRWEADGHDR